VFIKTLRFGANKTAAEKNENTEMPFHIAVTGCRMADNKLNKDNREKWE
jgi:hypothetical protein